MSEETELAIAPEVKEATGFRVLAASTTREFIRYFAASLVALVFDVAGLALMTSVLGVPYLISATISFSIGLAIVYVASICWVFENRSNMHRAAECTIFVLIGVVGLGINDLVLWLFTSHLGWFYLSSKFVSIFFVFSWSFLARKFVLFR